MRKKRIDNNQKEIVKELIQRGHSIDLDHNDFITGFRGKNIWLEIKSSSPFTKGGKLKADSIRDSQYKLLWTWRGQYNIVWNIEQVLNIGYYEDSIEYVGITPAMFRSNFKDWLSPEKLKYLREEKIIDL